MNDILLTVVLALAVWRVSYMLVYEAGPFDVFETLRYVARHNVIGRLLTCVYCTSVWVSAGALAIVHYEAGRYVIYWLALSAGAVLIHAIVERLRRGL